MRNKLFLSHASPEDNEFTLWLALQLAKEGYPVWCDLTKFLGGEDFWNDIEQAIRERTVKFLYVLSKTSNRKQGPLQELQVAHTIMRQHDLRDFIIPLLIDELPVEEVNIQLSTINAIPFKQGWGQGLHTLLQKLERDGVSKSPHFTPSAVGSWWREQFSANRGVSNQPEEYLSNWFPIESLPQNLYFHALRRSQIGRLEVTGQLPYPAFQHNQYLVSFAQTGDFEGRLGAFMSISDTHPFSTQDFLDGNVDKKYVDRKQVRDFVSRLLGMGWEAMARERRLPTYEFANGAICCYFTKGLVENDRVSFTGIDGKGTYRNMVGYKTTATSTEGNPSKRYWHFGIQAKPLVYPAVAYVIKPHVLFSSDGSQIWESKSRLHKARRSQCKNWWNPDWRDRILAAMAWLATQEGKIEIGLGSDVAIEVSSYPMTLTSPVSYVDPGPDRSLITEEDGYALEGDDYEAEEDLDEE